SGQSQSVFKTSPSSLNFGSVRVGQNAEKTLTITNTGGAPDTISQIKSSNPAFKVTTTGFPKTLKPSASVSVTVQFAPTQIRNESGTLSILNASGSTGGSVPVFGTGVGGTPNIQVSPTSLDFGQLDVGTFKTQNVTISNTGEGPLDITLPVDPA